eukprot:2548720-Pleurochrysis_carterae.AAC.1
MWWLGSELGSSSHYYWGCWCARCGWDRNPAYLTRARGRGDDSQNYRHSASMKYSPIRHWERGDRMAPLTQHSPSTH